MKQTFTSQWNKIIHLFFGEKRISCTPGHKFWLPEKGKYLSADSLMKGVKVLTLAVGLMSLDSVAYADTNYTAYNFEVEDHHNYFVGEDEILVHNHCALPAANIPLDELEDFLPLAQFPNRDELIERLGKDMMPLGSDGVPSPLFGYIKNAGTKELRVIRVNCWSKVQDLPETIRLNTIILDEIVDWSDNAIFQLRDKINLYPGLAIELSRKLKLGNLELDLIQYFRRFFEDDYIKYSMAGFSKRAANPFDNFPVFNKMIDDTEIIVSDGSRYNFHEINLDRSSPRFLGKVFDDVIETKITIAWITGDFSSFKPPLREKLEFYKSNNFELIIKGKVKIGGKMPEPDILFIPTAQVGDEIIRDFNNVEYPDIKYLWDVNFSTAQRKITNDLPANVEVSGNMDVVGSTEPIAGGTTLVINRVYKLAPTENMELDLILQ